MDKPPIPENDLERALYLAAEELAYYPVFLEELMRSSVMLLAHPGWGENENCFYPFIHWPYPSDQTLMVIPCFSSPLVAQASINVVSKIQSSLEDYSDHCVEVPFSELAPMGYPNVIFQLNPVSPFGAELYPDDIGLLLGAIPASEKAHTQDVDLGLLAPEIVPDDLMFSLSQLFCQFSDIDRAYLLFFTNKKQVLSITWLLLSPTLLICMRCMPMREWLPTNVAVT
ncbi:hypothetical protein [Teredinibacter haidensis]|uniref:hypothetical protein n=1 Tax=Teredinibacter haidensis TaxID=2731755 RepID=UPI000948F02D|nr:hypothetical protein [Teredinibacter haidensis]